MLATTTTFEVADKENVQQNIITRDDHPLSIDMETEIDFFNDWVEENLEWASKCGEFTLGGKITGGIAHEDHYVAAMERANALFLQDIRYLL